MDPTECARRLEALRIRAAQPGGLSPAECAELLDLASRLQRKLVHWRRLQASLDQRLAMAEDSLSLSTARRVGAAVAQLRERLMRVLGNPPKPKPVLRGEIRIQEFLTPRGPFVAAYDSLGRLSPDAIPEAAHKAAQSEYDLLYADEAQADAHGQALAPLLRPDWSPELLSSCMYMGRFLAISKSAWEAAAGFSGMYDLAKRVTARSPRVARIPKVLYYAPPSGVELGQSAAPLGGGPLASLIVCSRNGALLKRCLAGVARQTRYRPYEVVVVAHRGFDDGALDAAARRHGATVVPYTGPFHFALMCNQGAAAARGDLLVFLNDDVVPLVADWLGFLAVHAVRNQVGAVGAKLVYPSGTIQHAGVAVGIMDGAGHPGRGTFGRPWWPWLDFTREVSAVTGACLALRAEVFRSLGGYDQRFPVNYNDVDLCLRLRSIGLQVLVEPRALLRHDECRSRVGRTTVQERELLYDLWGDALEAGDPFYHPALPHDREDLWLA